MLHLNNIHKSFGEAEVLKGVDFSVSSGEIVGLIGVSGSGKTVLARCAVGLEVADGGALTLSENNFSVDFSANSSVEWSQLRQSVGYVSQVRALPPYRTVLDLVQEGPKYVLGYEARQAEGVALELLEKFQLANHCCKYPGEISGGQLARVCLARALAMKPDYLICDEITANLDPVAAAGVGKALLKASGEGVGLVMISHQLGFLREFGTRVDFLSDGVIIESGPPTKVFEEPKDERVRQFIEMSKVSV